MSELAQRLRDLSSAEDCLAFFAVPYDAQWVNANRPQILERFFQNVRLEPAPQVDNAVALYRCYRTLLLRTYNSFVKSTPAREKVLDVFRYADVQPHRPLQSLRSSLRSATRGPVAAEPA